MAAESLVNLSALAEAQLVREPFPHLVVRDFLPPSVMADIDRDFPDVPKRGSFPMSELQSGPSFASLVAYLESNEIAQAFSEKLGLDLTGKPTTMTIRGFSGEQDGRVHTDSRTKLVTVLLYLNSGWNSPDGRLRLLRSDNLDDWFDEVPPDSGTLLAFVNTKNAWHGHKPFVGQRRSIQLNWVVDEAAVRRSQWRHGLSARIKRWFGHKPQPDAY
ncbi:2OG-Fe(II) oxygenase [Halothiobacillus sp.]|uniref:2OG-Fe(II) oxygenase n=1 Tax=Halothiobacillus sp. TaxID=1891311 RepID=UPI002AD458F5|nr:2OG-Fe(II) oxygenase [Halothiobacillus sp.]